MLLWLTILPHVLIGKTVAALLTTPTCRDLRPLPGWQLRAGQTPIVQTQDCRTLDITEGAPFEVVGPEGRLEAHQHNTANGSKPVISFPGGGIFFWWQAGAITYLEEHYDLTNPSVDVVGASAGALAGTLAACGIDIDESMDVALQLCDEYNVWKKPLGLFGIWGSLVRIWLDRLLPPNAHELCRGRVHLLVLRLSFPRPRRQFVTDFESRQDLIDACMASVHLPFFMDKHFSCRFRGKRYMDGSFRARYHDVSLGKERPTVWLDYEDDPVMLADRGSIVKLTNKEGLLKMRQKGYNFAKSVRERGGLDSLSGIQLDQHPHRGRGVGGVTP